MCPRWRSFSIVYPQVFFALIHQEALQTERIPPLGSETEERACHAAELRKKTGGHPTTKG
jgi:hypothetical protein